LRRYVAWRYTTVCGGDRCDRKSCFQQLFRFGSSSLICTKLVWSVRGGGKCSSNWTNASSFRRCCFASQQTDEIALRKDLFDSAFGPSFRRFEVRTHCMRSSVSVSCAQSVSQPVCSLPGMPAQCGGPARAGNGGRCCSRAQRA